MMSESKRAQFVLRVTAILVICGLYLVFHLVTSVKSYTIPDSEFHQLHQRRPIPASFFNIDDTMERPIPIIVNVSVIQTPWLNHTDTLQRHLWRRQHPADCSTAKLYILDFQHKEGPGSYLHMFTVCFMQGLDSGRTVVLSPQLVWDWTSANSKHCQERSLQCYFLPLSNCTVPADYRKHAIHFSMAGPNSQWVYRDKSDHCFQYDDMHTIPQHFGKDVVSFEQSHFFWTANLIRYVMRPNQRTMDLAIRPAFNVIFTNSSIPHDFAALFIRGGDKVSEMTLHNVDEYMPWINRMNTSTLYVESDSATAIEQTVSLFKNSSTVTVITMPSIRGPTGHVYKGLQSTMQSMLNTDAIESHFYAILANAFVAIQARHLAGTLGSNWCRIIHELHDAGGYQSYQYNQVGICGVGHRSGDWCIGD
jgi:hypothetical protein